MPKLLLQFEDRVLKECAVGSMVTIGRLPDNTVVIDNRAVSGHHARVIRDGDHYIVEDLDSTNGTYVNEKHVIRQTLHDGDIVLVGKHKLTFVEREPAETEAPLKSVASMGDTVYLDTKKHRAMLATLRQARAQAKTVGTELSGSTAGAGPRRLGVLRVLAGETEQLEYTLEARTSFIGKSDAALVRLRGWFKPKKAVAIAQTDHGYVLTVLAGKALVNYHAINERCNLKDGDVLEVGGLMLEFRSKDGTSQPRIPPVSQARLGSSSMDDKDMFGT